METKPILHKKIFLYLTEFFAGMSVMAVELGASRLLAPYFSSSQIVWTIIIGTIMIAMALGNVWGGRRADKNPNPDRLYLRILVASLWIAAVPVVGKYLIVGISALLILSVNTGFLIIAGFAACFLIFVFPLFLLGTVTPSLVKFTVGSLDDSGKTVGYLNAFNTVGSIIGTFVPTFISIPAVGTAITFLIFAGILLVLSLVYFLSGGFSFRKNLNLPVSVLLFALCCLLGYHQSFAFWQSNLTYEGESIYNYLQVYEDDEKVVLSTNVLFGVQSVYMKEKGLTGMYYDYAMAAPLMAGANEKESCDVLVLGMGTGTFATQCSRYFENVSSSGVEIDGKITSLARKYFDLPESIPVVTYDGRAYLQASDGKYDVIMVDAYQDITIPFQMASLEFFRLVSDHLNPGGVMVVNMNMRADGADGINARLSDTIAAVFPTVYTIDVPGSTNRELFASASTDLTDNLSRNLTREDDSDLVSLGDRILSSLVPYTPTGGAVMTDDRAPVELLSMRAIDAIIREEVAYYKRIYRERGLKGLLEAF